MNFKTIRTIDASELVRHIADPKTPAWVHDGPLTIDEARAEFDRRFPVRAAQPEPPGWRTIESAPRDGTRILVIDAYEGWIPMVAAWKDGAWEVLFRPGMGFIDAGAKSHWMPLPEVPR